MSSLDDDLRIKNYCCVSPQTSACTDHDGRLRDVPRPTFATFFSKVAFVPQ